MKNNFIIASFGIIFDAQNRILLCHRRDYDLWNLPGGTMIAGESPWECVIREVEEETGFKVEIEKLIGIYNKPEKSEVCFSFICKIISGQPTINQEADRIEYFDLKDIPKNTSQKQLERIKDAIKVRDSSEETDIIFKNQIGRSSIELIKEGKM